MRGTQVIARYGGAAHGGSTMAMSEDRGLVEAATAGDREAAEALAEATYRQVYGALYRLCGADQDLAADLTQETYRRAWKSLASFRGKAKISTWLYRIAYTTFLNHIRRPRPLLPFEEGAQEKLEASGPSQEEALDHRMESERLRRAVMELPEKLRFTVTSRFWGELPMREIARLEGITAVAVSKRLKKAMRLLELALEEEA